MYLQRPYFQTRSSWEVLGGRGFGRTLCSPACPRCRRPPVCFTVRPLKDAGSFQVCASASKAATNILVQVLCEHEFLFLWDKHSRAQLLGRMVVVRSVSGGAAGLCPRVAVRSDVPTRRARAGRVPCGRAGVWCRLWFHVSRSGGRRSVTSHCGINSHPPSG